MSQVDIRVGNQKFKILAKVGEGAFGAVYSGVNVSNQEEVAIKMENTRESKTQVLFYETKVYKTLKGGPGIPNIYWEGLEGEFNCMVMEMLGPSLEDLFQYCDKRFTIKTTAVIAE
jgi:serine/threonine protein kinase